MSSHDRHAQMDQLLVQQGVIEASLIGEYEQVHESVARFRQKAGALFSLDTLKDGEAHLRAWLTDLRGQGVADDRLHNYLRCGLGHLCLDFIEFTYESLTGQELIDRAYSSFSRREYHRASLPAEPVSARGRKKSTAPAPRKKR